MDSPPANQSFSIFTSAALLLSRVEDDVAGVRRLPHGTLLAATRRLGRALTTGSRESEGADRASGSRAFLPPARHPCNPPPITTDATLAGVGSLLAESRGVLREYIVEMMRAEWAGGQDIGIPEVRNAVAAAVGLEVAEYDDFVNTPAHQARLAEHWREAQDKGVIGVPSFMIDDQIFWGNDRVDFVLEHLNDLRFARR